MPDVIFAFFDGEECKIEYNVHDGLHGSCRMVEWLAKNRQNNSVLALILLDMVGDKDLKVEIPPNSSGKLMQMTFDAAHKINARKCFTIGKEAILDDHVPFLNADIPAIVLIDFHYGSAPDKNDYWHTTNDTIDKISADSMETAGKVAIELFNNIIKEEVSVQPR
jgi:Zn-dependent M28 family amino/carboxypeptidase